MRLKEHILKIIIFAKNHISIFSRRECQKDFRCDYGACIDFRKRCNGQIDCADGSDEDTVLCSSTSIPSKNNITISSNVQSGKPPSRITQKPPVAIKPPKSSLPPTERGCIVPKQPSNGKWKMDKSLCIHGTDCDPLLTTNMLPPSVRINIHCNFGYRIVGPSSFYCGEDGQWSDTQIGLPQTFMG